MSRLALLVLLALAACAPAGQGLRATGPVVVSPGEVAVESAFQRQLVVEQRVLDRQRLETLQFRLMRGAVDFCAGRTRPFYGLYAATEQSFGARMRGPARDAFGLDDRLKVLYVVAGSPAAAAGLRPGATIAAVDGRPLPSGIAGARALKAALEARGGGGPARLTLAPGDAGETGGTVAISPVETCDFDVAISSRRSLNAYAIGKRIIVTREMMWFARDDELALVVAHELAHHVLRHAERAVPGANFKEIEAEADYVGLYIMARAGYAIENAPRFWRRLAANFPGAIGAAASHPATAYRYLVLRKTVREINAKIAAGRPLTPNRVRILAANEIAG